MKGLQLLEKEGSVLQQQNDHRCPADIGDGNEIMSALFLDVGLADQCVRNTVLLS